MNKPDCGIWGSMEEMEKDFDDNEHNIKALVRDLHSKWMQQLRPCYKDVLDNCQALDMTSNVNLQALSSRIEGLVDSVKALSPEVEQSQLFLFFVNLKSHLDSTSVQLDALRTQLGILRDLIQSNMNPSNK